MERDDLNINNTEDMASQYAKFEAAREAMEGNKRRSTKSGKSPVRASSNGQRKRPRRPDKPELSLMDKLKLKLSELTGLDYVIIGMGALVLLVSVLVLSTYTTNKAIEAKVREFTSLGNQLSQIGLKGQGTMMAMADSKVVIIDEEDFLSEYEERDSEDSENGQVTVEMVLTSVMKDLKIKFTNKRSGKLIPGVLFQVEVTDSKGKKSTYTDEDKDGIIYIAKIEHGETIVAIKSLTDDTKYKIDTAEQKINVKENIEYKKIDVSNEIKKESEINIAKEEANQELETEGALKDTVQWVESTKTPTGTTTKYVEVKLAEISVPKSVSSVNIFSQSIASLKELFTSEVHINVYAAEETTEPTEGTDPTEEPDPTAEVSPTTEVTPEPTPEPTAEPTDTPSPSPTINPTPTQQVIPSPSISPSPKPSPSMSPTPSVDDKEALKTIKGEQLYYKSGSDYVAATVGYYRKNTSITYYKQVTDATGYKYTGWQTIDGVTYFFTADGNKVTGDQVIQGAKYSFASDGSLKAGNGNLGIDVSKFNGNIDWTKVRESGVSYVIIRSGFRGYGSGVLVEDTMFRQNIKGATAAGLKVGVYFFTQAVNEVEAVEEASMVLSQISGYKISYPIFIDVEASGAAGNTGRADGLDYNTRTKVINAFCSTIQNAGYSAGVYASKSWLTGKFNPGALGAYKIWLAQYNTTPTYSGRYNMWQYSSKGRVNGISGNVDMNLSYLGY